MISQVFILTLTYDISFRDSDEGDCYAGQGCKILSVYADRTIADSVVAEIDPLFSAARKESPHHLMQVANSKLKRMFGFTLYNIDGYNFELVVKPFDIVSQC